MALSFPYRKLTIVEAGSSSPLWAGTLQKTGYRYLWYEMGNDGTGDYLISADRDFLRKGALYYYSISRRNDKLFKLHLLARLHLLQSLPDTRGRKPHGIVELIYERLRNIE